MAASPRAAETSAACEGIPFRKGSACRNPLIIEAAADQAVYREKNNPRIPKN